MMPIPVVDAHIHLDQYGQEEIRDMIRTAGTGDASAAGWIAVSTGLASCRRTLALARESPGKIFPAFGFHPEQPLPEDERELERLFGWIREHRGEMIAVGEVGLPYYTRKQAEAAGVPFDGEPYLRLLERFIRLASELDKPIVLHAVYEDADAACRLLAEHGVRRAHFHWYKGSEETTGRLADCGYMVSVTPDLAYKERTRELVRRYPLELLMVETDGPWPFEGPYAGRRTGPAMLQDILKEIAAVKGITLQAAGEAAYANTKRFYGLP